MLQYAAARAPPCRQRSAAALRPRAAAREATPARRRDAYMIKDGGIGDFGQTQERRRSLSSAFKRRGLSPEAQRAGPSKPVVLWSGGGVLTVLSRGMSWTLAASAWVVGRGGMEFGLLGGALVGEPEAPLDGPRSQEGRQARAKERLEP